MAGELQHTTWDGLPISDEPPFGATVVVFRVRDDRFDVRMLHRAHHGPDYTGDWAWTPPAGARLPGELVEDCARRELRETRGSSSRWRRLSAARMTVGLPGRGVSSSSGCHRRRARPVRVVADRTGQRHLHTGPGPHSPGGCHRADPSAYASVRVTPFRLGGEREYALGDWIRPERQVARSGKR